MVLKDVSADKPKSTLSTSETAGAVAPGWWWWWGSLGHDKSPFDVVVV